MRSTELLRAQHRSLEELIGRAVSAGGPERVRLIGRLAEEITLYAALEEEHLYPALRANGLGATADRSAGEADRVRALVSEILEIKRSDPRLEGKVAELASVARAHLASEGKAVLPALEEAFSPEQLEAMGAAMGGLADRLRGAELLKLADEREPAHA